jgi:hypothetical protein
LIAKYSADIPIRANPHILTVSLFFSYDGAVALTSDCGLEAKKHPTRKGIKTSI